MKKFFSLVLALVMALSLTTVAWGAVTTHEVTDVDTLKTAVANADDGDTILLKADVTIDANDERVIISGDKTVTLSAINNAVLYTCGADNPDSLTATNGGTLILDSSLKVVASDRGVIWADGGTIVVNGATITSSALACPAAVRNGGKLIVNAGSVISSSNFTAITCKGTGSVLEINGGTISATGTDGAGGNYVTVHAADGGVINMNDGVVKGAAALDAGVNGTINMYGGTVESVNANDSDTAKVNIYGGTVTGAVTTADGAKIVVTAGTFPNADVIPYLATGSVYKDGVVTKQGTVPSTGTTSTGTVTSGTVTPSKPTLYKLAAVGGSMVKDDEDITEIKLTTTSGRLQNDVPLYVPNIYKVDNFYYIQVAKADADYALYNNGAWIYLFRTPYSSDADAIKAYATSVVMDKLVTPADENIDCGDCLKNGALASYYVSGDSVYYAGGNTWAYFNGEFVKYDKDTKVVFQDHTWDATSIKVKATDVKGTKVPVTIECSECEKTFSIVGAKAFDNTWVMGVNYTVDPAVSAYGQYYIVLTSGTSAPVVTPSTDKVQSAATFDAGIAMYVGMSVLAATGSAVVIGKKKD